MTLLRQLRHALLVALVFAYSVVEVLLLRPRTRAARAAWLSALCDRLMRCMHITVSSEGPVPAHGAVISNHLNYTDILLHAAAHPSVFVSKIELRSMPVFGWVSMMAGTVYVARGAGGSAQHAGEGMAAGFRDGLPVVFFPEGTTGVGDVPTLPFRSGLLAQSIAAQVPVTPAFVHYTLPALDLAQGRSVRRDVHWGDVSLPRHLWNFFRLHGLHGHIRFADQPISFSPEALANRKIAALEAAAAVAALAPNPPSAPHPAQPPAPHPAQPPAQP